MDAVRLVDEQVEFGEALVLPLGDALGPLGESRLVGRVPSYPPNRTRTNGAVTRMCKASLRPAVSLITAPMPRSRSRPTSPRLVRLLQTIRGAETPPPPEVPAAISPGRSPWQRHAWAQSGEEVDERGAEFVSEGQESINEVVGWSVAVVEATEVGDDLRKPGAKRESRGIVAAHSAMWSAGWMR